MTSDIFLSEVACTPGLTASHMVQSSSENDSVRKRSVLDSKLQSPRHKANLIDQKSLFYSFEYLLIPTLVSKGAKE